MPWHGTDDFNMTAACEHVGEIERAARLIKERSRYFMKTLVVAGILRVHKQIMIHIIYFVTIMLNSLPATLVFSYLNYPHEIVTQQKLDMNKD